MSDGPEHHTFEQEPKDHWILKKEINVGMLIALAISIIGGVVAFSTLRADVGYKADSARVAVVESRVERNESDLEETRGEIKQIHAGIQEILTRMPRE